MQQTADTHTETHTRCARDTLCQAATFASYKPQREAEAKEKGQDKVCVRRRRKILRADKDARKKRKRSD